MLMGGMRVGTLGPLALGLSIPPPSLQAHHRRAAKPPGLCCSSQNPAFTLLSSEFLLVLFFISVCCAQDCEFKKPLRSRHECKHMRVYLQDQARVQVYPTQQSRDLDLEVGFSLVLWAGLGDLQEGWRNFSSSVYIMIWGFQEH